MCLKFCSLRQGSLVGNFSPVKNTTGYELANMSQKSQGMTTRSSYPTLPLLVRQLLSYGLPHTPIEIAKFEKFCWWNLIITQQPSLYQQRVGKLRPFSIFPPGCNTSRLSTQKCLGLRQALLVLLWEKRKQSIGGNWSPLVVLGAETTGRKTRKVMRMISTGSIEYTKEINDETFWGMEQQDFCRRDLWKLTCLHLHFMLRCCASCHSLTESYNLSGGFPSSMAAWISWIRAMLLETKWCVNSTGPKTLSSYYRIISSCWSISWYLLMLVEFLWSDRILANWWTKTVRLRKLWTQAVLLILILEVTAWCFANTSWCCKQSQPLERRKRSAQAPGAYNHSGTAQRQIDSFRGNNVTIYSTWRSSLVSIRSW